MDNEPPKDADDWVRWKQLNAPDLYQVHIWTGRQWAGLGYFNGTDKVYVVAAICYMVRALQGQVGEAEEAFASDISVEGGFGTFAVRPGTGQIETNTTMVFDTEEEAETFKHKIRALIPFLDKRYAKRGSEAAVAATGVFPPVPAPPGFQDLKAELAAEEDAEVKKRAEWVEQGRREEREACAALLDQKHFVIVRNTELAERIRNRGKEAE